MLSPPDYAKYNSNNGYHQKYMDEAAGDVINKKTYHPNNYQDYSNDV